MALDLFHDLLHRAASFGPAAIFLGAGLEGQSAVIAGGALARKGLIPLQTAFAAACLGSAVIDQLLFLLGRYGRRTRLAQRMTARPAFAKAIHFIERRPFAFILVFRFLYGLRAVSPVAIGVSNLGAWLFTALNLVAAGVWAALFTGIGFYLAKGFGAWLERAQSHEGVAVAGAVALALALGAYVIVRHRSHRAASEES